MPTRKSKAKWTGKLRGGKGLVTLGSGMFEGEYSFVSRFKEGKGTNPEELIGAAHAGCFSMALALGLEKAGHDPEEVETKASVRLDPVDDGFAITRVKLETAVRAKGLDEKTLQAEAARAKTNCPVSRALTGVQIEVEARLG